MSNEKYTELLAKRWDIYNSIFGLNNFNQRLEKRINREGGKKSLKELENIISVKDKKLLDAGSCCGEFLYEAVSAGAIGYGIEPDDLSLEISKLLFQANNKKAELTKDYVEHLPFSADTFDIVVSVFILEHVNNPEKAILEMIRVLKPGGKLWIKCPNFLSPYEYHYKRYYFPFLPKFIEQEYFNLISGHKTDYFLRLHRITSLFIFKILKKHNIKYQKINIYPEINLIISKRLS